MDGTPLTKRPWFYIAAWMVILLAVYGWQIARLGGIQAGLLEILLDLLCIFPVLLILWMAFFAQFVLPVHTFEDRQKVFNRLLTDLFGGHGPALFIENGEITSDQVRARMEATQATETPFIAEQEGQPAGFAFLRVVPALATEEPFAEITELYVEDLTQREMISGMMAAKLEELAREKGASFLILLTGLRNTEAKNTYRAMGYIDYALALRKRLK